MALRAIVFDLFDTLVDLHRERLPDTPHGRGTTTRLHEIVSEHHPIGLDAFARELRQSDRELFGARHAAGLEVSTLERMQALLERLGLDDPELARALGDEHMRLLRSVAVPQPHHPELLAGLARDFRLAVCSNFSHTPTAHRLLDEADLRGSLDVVVVSDTCGFRKPRPEIFAEVLRELGCEPAETLHVGDSLREDIAGAAGARMNTAWLTRRVRDPEAALADYEGPRPDHVLADLAELEALVRP